MLFELCKRGVGAAVHPDELGKRLTSRQISEWMACDRLNPLDGQWDRLLLATIAAMIGNSAGGKQDDTPFTADEFLPESMRTPEPEQSAQDVQDRISRKLAAVAAALRGKRGDNRLNRS